MVERVIVIDDDALLCEMLCESMELLGAAWCRTFVSLAALQQSREALTADLAILDINLGSGKPTGLDVAAYLHEHDFAGRIVFLTGHARNHPLVRAACDLASTRILQKPTSLATLAGLLEGDHG
jgi:ActR/RegA family two-component response regulator